MTESEAINLIERALQKALDKKISVNSGTDLFKEKILDSLDTMVFFLELEEVSGKKFPEENLAEAGFSKVGRIVEFLVS
jgi:acyl carrier protein